MTIWTPQAHAPPLICMEQILVPILFHFCSTSGTLLPMWLKKKRRQKMPKSFWKSIASGIGPRGGSYELDRCNLQLQLIQNPPIHHSLFPRSPSSSSQSQSLSLSLSRSLSLMAIATESPQQEKVIQLGKKMPLSCVIRVLICIRWGGFLCFSDLNSLYPFAWFVKINGFSLFL